MLSAVRAAPWSREGLLVGGGAAVMLAATADTVRSVYARFTADLAGLSFLERGGVALWDFAPLGAAVFGIGALALLGGLADGPRRPRIVRAVEPPLALLLSAYATLGLVVIALAVWIGAAGRVGDANGLAVRYDGGERAVTLATQILGWGPLVGLFAFVAYRRAARPEDTAPQPELRSLSEEMDALWRERIAFSPNRERGRVLLQRIRTLEETGDLSRARALADELRRL